MALSGLPIQVTEGSQIRDFVYADDVGSAFIKAAAIHWSPKYDKRGLVINVGTGIGTSVRKIVETIANYCGRDIAAIQFGAMPHRNNEMSRLVADPSAALKLLGWRAKTTLNDGLWSVIGQAVVSSDLRLDQSAR